MMLRPSRGGGGGRFMKVCLVIMGLQGIGVNVTGSGKSGEGSSSLVTSFLNLGSGEAGDDERRGMICGGKTHESSSTLEDVPHCHLPSMGGESNMLYPGPPKRATLDAIMNPTYLDVTSVPGPPERATLDAIMNSTSSDATSVPGPPECAMLEVIGATTLRAVFEPPLLDGGSIDASSFEMQHSLENLGSVDSVYGSRSTADEQSLSYMHVPSTEPSITTVVKLESTEHSTRVVELETTEPVVTDVKLAVSNTNSSTTSESTEPVVTDVKLAVSNTNSSTTSESTEPVVTDVKVALSKLNYCWWRFDALLQGRISLITP